MYRIWKEFHFSASHQLTHLPNGHPCARLHGHNYVVEVELTDTVLDDHGFVLDYNALAPFRKLLDDHFDHQHLNDVLGEARLTTAENMARHLYGNAVRLCGDMVSAVRVRETDKTCAEYRP